jgi:hypothetical protein
MAAPPLATRDVTPADVDAVRQGIADYLTVGEIGERLGLTLSQVKALMRKHALTTDYRGTEKRAAVVALLQALPELADEDIAEEVGCGVAMVREARRRLNPPGRPKHVEAKPAKAAPAPVAIPSARSLRAYLDAKANGDEREMALFDDHVREAAERMG